METEKASCVQIDNEAKELSEQIDNEADGSLAETMWGKPANDIITGISNNSAVPANRAIWELVQNARDVSRINGKAEIRFIRRVNEFVFEHNGQPFDRKSILALILQTSSKVRNDIVKVGQYGTGFLTTHKFGLKFKLEGALRVVPNKDLFFNFGKTDIFYIDRSSRDTKVLSVEIQKQVNIEQQWGKDLTMLQSVPSEHTVFTYLHDHDIERKNVEEAFAKSPELAPYVLALNPLVGSIAFQDEVTNTCHTYCILDRKPEWESETILLEKVSVGCGSAEKHLNLYLLKSKNQKDDATHESKVTIIMPWTSETTVENISYHEVQSNHPQIYLYLPLLGTENWGWNYIIHAPAFTCDKDSRDSLLFVGNGQNNDDQAELNRELISIAGTLIKEYLSAKMLDITDRKYLGRVNFMPAPHEKLNDYYTKLQDEWVNYFEQQPLVKKEDLYLCVSSIKVLDDELYKACESDSLLLDAIYDLLSKEIHNVVLPAKCDLVHWSRYIDEWYVGKSNKHSISLKDICAMILSTPLKSEDIDWLHKICQYLKDNPHNDIALKTIVPNENLKLVDCELVKPIAFSATFRTVLKTLVPVEVEKFVHADFLDIMSDAAEYGQIQAKTALTAFVTGINTNCTTLKNAIVSKASWRQKEYEDRFLSSDNAKAILDLYKILLPEGGSGFTSRMFNLLTEYYNYFPESTEKIDKELFDIRNCYNVLINDSLLQFTLLADKTTKATWILSMVKELYGFADAQSFLRNYMVYPDQVGIFKYSSQLKKQQNMPARLKEIYNIICSKNIQTDLVSADYQDHFVETGLLTGKALADEIEKPFVDSNNYSIEKNAHQNLYVEIIEKFGNPVEGSTWISLFTNFSSHKASMMLSAMNSPQKRDSIFQLMKIEDVKRLSAIAEMAQRDDFERILQLGKEARDRELQERNDFEFKKALGLYVEDYLLTQLNNILAEDSLQVSVIDEQGGQDIKVIVNGKTIYYIEVKSRWNSERSILMSTLQHQTSYIEKEHYALCVVDMSHYDRSLAEQHIYPDIDQIKDNIRVLTNIGALNERMRDAVEDNGDTVVHIAGGYQVLVSQIVIKNNGTSFDSFISSLKDCVARSIL